VDLAYNIYYRCVCYLADMTHTKDFVSPYTGDINYGIVVAVIAIALFVIFILLRGRRR
jgi:hypothetical protein